MTPEAVSALVAKNSSLNTATAKAKLAAMEPGAYCVHRSWGFGRIVSYNDATQKLVIDFQSKPGHPMDPAFCVTTLDVLPNRHLLVRKATEPAVISDLIEKNPVQLVAEALASYPNQATTQIDLELTLAQVVGEDKFKRWWSTTKKALAKDPRIFVPTKKTECFVLREEPVAVEDEILSHFHGTRSARRRIEYAEKLLAATSKDTTADIASVINDLAASVKDSNQLDAAERLYGAYIRDALADMAGRDPATFTPSQSDLVQDSRDLQAISEKIPATFQSEFLDLIHASHPIDYRDICFNLLKASSGKFTTECINFLVEKGHADELGATLQRWQTEQNLRAPVLEWIVKNRHSKKFAKLLNPLITPRLLSAIFFAIDFEALQAATQRRIPLADKLHEDTDLIPDLLATADPETARDLANTLLLNQGFEELTKKSLLARFIKIFPNIQSLVAADAESKDEQLLVSRASHDRKREEYELLVSKKIPDNSNAIAVAREHGDLKENSEYKMAKQDQQVLMAQKTLLERELSRARITDFKEATSELVSVGSVVEVNTGSGKTSRYAVLGAWDSDPDNGVIAYKTPLGLALLTKKVGESVTVRIGSTEETYTISSISRYVDTAAAP